MPSGLTITRLLLDLQWDINLSLLHPRDCRSVAVRVGGVQADALELKEVRANQQIGHDALLLIGNKRQD